MGSALRMGSLRVVMRQVLLGDVCDLRPEEAMLAWLGGLSGNSCMDVQCGLLSWWSAQVVMCVCLLKIVGL